MSAQPDLFGPYAGPVPARPADTSVAAAVSLARDAPRLRAEVHAAIRRAGAAGLTADEAAAALGLTPFSTRPRCTELAAAGLVADSGMRRRNASGRSAIVWVSVS